MVNNNEVYDKVIIGGGIFGLYSALLLSKGSSTIAVIEREHDTFSRASFINQARVHNGYHYPRSASTAGMAAYYYERFLKDFDFAINNSFKKLYAISNDYSKVTASEFWNFCKEIGIPLKKTREDDIFNYEMIEEAFEVEEASFDYGIIRDYLLKEISKSGKVKFFQPSHPTSISKMDNYYSITLNSGKVIETPFIVNATYASINQVLKKLDIEQFKIKYELCEVILCEVDSALKEVGVTVMDGPFFSIMPFGKSKLHSLTSVSYTPHIVSYDSLPVFSCQQDRHCSQFELGNCNTCKYCPASAWDHMLSTFKLYMQDSLSVKCKSSLFTIKPVLFSSEMDDSRPTIIKQHTMHPCMISIFSGKISSIFDLEKALGEYI